MAGIPGAGVFALSRFPGPTARWWPDLPAQRWTLPWCLRRWPRAPTLNHRWEALAPAATSGPSPERELLWPPRLEEKMVGSAPRGLLRPDRRTKDNGPPDGLPEIDQSVADTRREDNAFVDCWGRTRGECPKPAPGPSPILPKTYPPAFNDIFLIMDG